MSRPTLLLLALAAAFAGATGGFYFGVADGRARQAGEQAAETVQSLTDVIDAHKGLVADANAASRAMRQALAARAQADLKSTRELKDALARTASSRTGCVFDDGVMRQLDAARERAAAAAAGGIRPALPAASAASTDGGG